MNTTVNLLVLSILISLAMYFDLTQKKIPNKITFPVILWGLVTHTIFGGFEGLKFSGLGFLVGLAIFLIPFALGGMGGGDVKMLAAIGALMGWRFVLTTALYAGLIGGVMVILMLIRQRKLAVTLKRAFGIVLTPVSAVLTVTFKHEVFKKMNNYFFKQELVWEKQYIPYGVAIGLGAVLTYFI